MRLRPTLGEAALTIGLVAAVCVGPLVLRGSSGENARLLQNARRIQELTESERVRLDRNFKLWQGLSTAEQQQWRQFVDRLDADRAANHGRLSQAMQDYYDWLQSLPGYRREELRETADPRKRAELVEEILTDQLARRLDAPPADVRTFGRLATIPTLSSDELAEVMAALEDALLPEQLAQLVDRQSQELTGVERYFKVLALLISRYNGRPFEMLMNPQVRLRLLNSLPDHVREELQTGLDANARGPELANRLLAMLSLSVRLEAERNRARLRPTPDRLRQYFENDEKVSKDEQEFLLSLAADEFRAELLARYYRLELEGRVAIDFDQLQRFLRPEEFRRLREGVYQGDRPPGERVPPLLLPGWGPGQGRGERFNPQPEGPPRPEDRPPEGRRPGERDRRDDDRDRPRPPPPPPGDSPPRGERPQEPPPRERAQSF